MILRRFTILPSFALALLLISAPVLGGEAALLPTVQFLSPTQTAILLSGADAQAYFETMQVPDLEAKTQLDLQALPLDSARAQARQQYALAAQAFSADDQEVLVWALNRLHPRLLALAPLYARTPWSFAKVSDRLEGGLPHTRGDTIVLPEGVMAGLQKSYRRRDFRGLSSFLDSLLVHEQTHVLQRSQPALFDDLVTTVLGFVRVAEPQQVGLLKRRVVNPDAPRSERVYPLSASSAQAVMPYLVLSQLTMPRMPRDFQVVGLAARRDDAGWQVVAAEGLAELQSLERFQAYGAAFPARVGLYHPYELSADLLSYWLTGADDGDVQHPMRLKVAAWAEQGLK